MRDLELELPELILDMSDLSVDRVRLQGTLSQRLPSIPGTSVESFFMSNRAAEAAAYAAAMGIAFQDSHDMDVIMRAKSRAHARAAQRYAEGR
jgi:hypothetical protein